MYEMNEDAMYDAFIEQEAIEAEELAMQINALIPFMPLEVLQDVNQRITDWLSMGGKHSDGYIKQQLRYMQSVAQAMGGH